MYIKSAREKRGLTQKEVANRLNVERSTVAMWETGKATPNKLFTMMSKIKGVFIWEQKSTNLEK